MLIQDILQILKELSPIEECLNVLVENCYHEIALQYEKFMSILPIQQLSAEFLIKLLPPTHPYLESQKQEFFWNRVLKIAPNSTIFQQDDS